LAIWASPGLAVLEWQRAEVHAVGKQQVEGHVRRAVISEQEFVEERAAGVVEDHQLTIEHIALRRQTEHFLEALHAVAVARDQLATDGVGCGAEASKSQSGWSNGSCRRTGLINDIIPDRFNRQSPRDQTGDTRAAGDQHSG